MKTRELDYALPDELIAQSPLEERSASRLLLVDRALTESGHAHQMVRDLPALLPPSLFVVNETRVIEARLLGKKSTGGRAELLLVEPMATGKTPRWLCLGTANRPLSQGQVLHFGDGRAHIEERHEGGILEVRFENCGDFSTFISTIGTVPLPPYISRDVAPVDAERYQTIFAREPGAVAAPTAGLHFDAALVEALENAGHRFVPVTLHVGPGTFRPVQAERIDDHPMHEERYSVRRTSADAIVEAKAEGRPVVAIGTTVVRTLEAAALAAEEGQLLRVGEGRTDLFIRPGFVPKVVDHLFTNFHLPRSTLLALVMAFGGREQVRHAYEAAVEQRYRFFSYGDAMLIRGARMSTSP